jgi:hypothetical protein
LLEVRNGHNPVLGPRKKPDPVVVSVYGEHEVTLRGTGGKKDVGVHYGIQVPELHGNDPLDYKRRRMVYPALIRGWNSHVLAGWGSVVTLLTSACVRGTLRRKIEQERCSVGGPMYIGINLGHFIRALLIAAVLVSSGAVFSSEGTPLCSRDPVLHGGGLNKCGCHLNRKTGECHCHHPSNCGCSCQPTTCR